MRIKNWAKFQHFKDRKPPWIKLYRDLLDDMEWHLLDAEASKLLVMLWLIASEDAGELPDIKTLAFRLRMTEKQVSDCVSRLGHWVEAGDIKTISKRYHAATATELNDSATVDLTLGETETETEERERQKAPQAACVLFDKFWKAYPRKVGKDAARKEFDKRKPDDGLLAAMLSTLAVQVNSKQWTDDDGKFIPHPTTWLKQGRWQDEVSVGDDSSDMPDWMRGAI
jgi:hypothetical protein